MTGLEVAAIACFAGAGCCTSVIKDLISKDSVLTNSTPKVKSPKYSKEKNYGVRVLPNVIAGQNYTTALDGI